MSGIVGAIIAPNETWRIQKPCKMQVFSAALGSETLAKGSSSLCVRTSKQRTATEICTLDGNNNQVSLNKEFTPVDAPVEFSVIGSNPIHLIGSLLSSSRNQLVRVRENNKRKACMLEEDAAEKKKSSHRLNPVSQ